MSERIGRIFCAIGMHRWKWIGMSLFGDQAYMCKRPYCRACKQWFLAGATIHWKREERLEGDSHD